MLGIKIHDSCSYFKFLFTSNIPISQQIKPSHSVRIFCQSNQILNSPNSITHVSRKTCECFDLYKELIPYNEAWSWQKSIVKQKKALIERNEECLDALIILRHSPVYTMGPGSSEEYLNFDIKDPPFQFYRTERGGEVTYHGPEDQKLAAIGIRVSQRVTYDGLALNVTTDLTPFRWTVPCGIQNSQVGCIKGLLGECQSLPADFHDPDDCQLLEITHNSLIKEFSVVFQLDILHNAIPVKELLYEDIKLID